MDDRKSPSNPADPAAASPATGRAWLRVALACAMLVAAGGARAWQGRRVEAIMDQGKRSPFPLDSLPARLGDWKLLSDKDGKLNPEIAKGSGSTDNVFRTYVDERTGVQLGVIILYGPAVDVRIHAPELCYPGAGYAMTEGPDRREIKAVRADGSPIKALFSAMVFAKGEGGTIEREQVYYSWRYNDQWTPDVLNPKEFQRIPGMYKVHLQRRAAEKELLDENNPCETFLKVLLPEMERRLGEAARAKAGVR